MRILVTGSRDWTDREAIEEGITGYWWDAGCSRDVTVIHGHCPRGADRIADEVCTGATVLGEPVIVERHPAEWDTHGKAAGFIRNQQMVDLGADVCLAFIKGGSKGATDCANRAESAGIPTVRIVRD